MNVSQQHAQAGRRLRLVVLGFGGRPDVLREAERLRPVIERYADIVAADFSGSDDLSDTMADAAVVIGGDGSILRAAGQMSRNQLPVIAVNLGRLGFLADILSDELPNVLGQLAPGNIPAIEHLMLECRVYREDRCLAERLGLNEVAIQAGPPFTLLNVDLYVDAEWATSYSCDGLIVSTAIGSTGHSLSAGGPILRKDLDAFVICPISPHTLTNRPVVDSADRVYELVVAQPRAGTSVVLDGRVLHTLEMGDRVRVQRAEPRFKLVVAPGHSYYRTLREKLGWSGRLSLHKGPS